MTDTRRSWGDEKMEMAMGHLLRAGVVLAAIVVAIGAGVHLHAAKGVPVAEYRVFHGTPETYRHMTTITQAAFHGDGAAIIQFGLLLLIATPIARVVFAVFGFLAERDWLYTLVSAIVLGILVYSFVRAG